MSLHRAKRSVMNSRTILHYVPPEKRRALVKAAEKAKKDLHSLFFLVIYSVGSIQNKFQERKSGKERVGDYGRRWRKNLDRLIDAMQEDFLKEGILCVHVDPTRLDSMVARCRLGVLQPRLRRLQMHLKLESLFKEFDPIRYKEAEVLLLCGENVLVIALTHFAEISVSGGSAAELTLSSMAGVPVYLFCSEETLKKYRSRSVITSIIESGKRVVRGRNIFHTMEDTLGAIKRDIPRLRSHTPYAPLGELFVAYWEKKMAKGRLRKS
ncbi:MAG: hypothetical protein Q7R73_01760 [bacterium]|nr:hypothetical protein [bacterium]